jgi:YD repeat-containing protein
MIALFGVGPIAKHRFNITLLGVLIAVIIGLAINQARAEPQTRFYDSQGRSIGTAAPYGNGSVRYYDALGRSLGTSTTTGNTTRYYDARGRSLGTSTTTGNTTRFYDASGRSAGSASSPGSLAFPRR